MPDTYVAFSGNMEIIVISKGWEYTYPYPPSEVVYQVDKCSDRGNINGIWRHLKDLDFTKINLKDNKYEDKNN